MPSNCAESRVHSKSKEVRFDTIPEIHVYRDGISDTTEYNQVPADGVDSLLLTIKLFLSQTPVSARTFLSLLGKLSAAADFVLLGRLHFLPLQMCLLSVWRPRILPLDHQVPINRMIRFHLKWWMDTIRLILGTSIHPSDPNTFLFTDASHYGWGAHLEPMRLSGRKTNPSSILIFWIWWPFV